MERCNSSEDRWIAATGLLSSCAKQATALGTTVRMVTGDSVRRVHGNTPPVGSVFAGSAVSAGDGRVFAAGAARHSVPR